MNYADDGLEGLVKSQGSAPALGIGELEKPTLWPLITAHLERWEGLEPFAVAPGVRMLEQGLGKLDSKDLDPARWGQLSEAENIRTELRLDAILGSKAPPTDRLDTASPEAWTRGLDAAKNTKPAEKQYAQESGPERVTHPVRRHRRRCVDQTRRRC